MNGHASTNGMVRPDRDDAGGVCVILTLNGLPTSDIVAWESFPYDATLQDIQEYREWAGREVEEDLSRAGYRLETPLPGGEAIRRTYEATFSITVEFESPAGASQSIRDWLADRYAWLAINHALSHQTSCVRVELVEWDRFEPDE